MAVAQAAQASFAGSSSISQSIGTKRIFATTATVTAHDVEDASAGGAEAFAGNSVAFNDGNLYTSSTSLPTAFSSLKYVSFTFSNPLPAGLSVSGLSLSFGLRTGAASGTHTACYFVDLRQASTDALLSTYGSSGSPLACASTNTSTTVVSTSLSGVTTSSLADDLRVRAYIWVDAARKGVVDNAVITGSTPYGSFTLYPTTITDLTGTSLNVPYAPALLDGTFSSSAGSWQTSFATTRYLRLVFPSTVPTGATVAGATSTLTFRPATAGTNLCYYLAVYNGATLLATHGSSGSPIACNSAATFSTSVVSLPEINTVSLANNTQIRIYMRSSVAGGSQIDVATLGVGYSLN